MKAGGTNSEKSPSYNNDVLGRSSLWSIGTGKKSQTQVSFIKGHKGLVHTSQGPEPPPSHLEVLGPAQGLP